MGTHYRGTTTEIRALDACIKLLRASAVLRGRLDRAATAVGLTGSQLGVLEALWHLGPLEHHEIGRKLLVSRANVTLLVDRLVEMGLVRRKRGAKDRRCVHVSLTPAGRRRIEAVLPDHVSRIVDALAPLRPAEQEELARLCRKLGLAMTVE